MNRIDFALKLDTCPDLHGVRTWFATVNGEGLAPQYGMGVAPAPPRD